MEMTAEANSSSQEVWPSGFAGAKFGLTVVSISVVVFYVLGKIAEHVRPKVADRQQWRWKNISVSLLHAIFSGFGSILW